MKYLFSLAFVCCFSLFLWGSESFQSSFERIAEPTSPQNIQLLLEKDASEALLEVKGPYYIFNPHDGSRVSSGLLGKRFMVHELENGLKWGEEYPGIHQIYIKPRSEETKIFVNGIQYDGAIAIYGISGSINIVNDLEIETYVKSILFSEFSSPLESEVLSALAILVRTDAYYHAAKNKDSFWHISAREAGFNGAPLMATNSPLEKAVDSTRHLILVHPENGKNLPFATSWTENSAGKTVSYEMIFRKDAFCPEKGVSAPHAAINREESKWSYQTSLKSLAKPFGISDLVSIETFTDKESHKVYGIRLKGKEDTYDVDFITFQRKLGKNHILSSDFTLSVKDQTVSFKGFGKGHGVGLCLYSAEALAQNGENAVKILSKFFPETYLYNLNALPHKGVKKSF